MMTKLADERNLGPQWGVGKANGQLIYIVEQPKDSEIGSFLWTWDARLKHEHKLKILWKGRNLQNREEQAHFCTRAPPDSAEMQQDPISASSLPALDKNPVAAEKTQE